MNKFKVAILGCENSHANSFLNMVSNGTFPQLDVVGIYSDEDANAEKLVAEHGVKRMERYDELVGQLDGLIVTARHGDNHYKYAKPYLDSGIPMFIDKPITIDPDEAVTFMREAIAKGVKLCGGSVVAMLDQADELRAFLAEKKDLLIGGHLDCPLHIDSPYGGFYFYSQHLVQLMCSIFGYDVKTVFAKRQGHTVNFIASYENFSVTATFGEFGYYLGEIVAKDDFKHVRLTFTQENWASELGEFVTLLEGGDMPHSYQEFVEPVFILNAIEKSYETGLPVMVEHKRVVSPIA